MTEEELILTKLKIVSEEKENGAYICDKKHSKILLNYIKQKDKIINKASKEIKTILKMALEQDSENVNLIDRLKYILDVLKGDSK